MSDTFIAGERHVSEVRSSPMLNRKQTAVVIGIGGAAVAAFFAFHGVGKKHEKVVRPAPAIHQIVPYEPPKAMPVSMPIPVAAPPALPPAAPAAPLPLIQRIIPHAEGDPLAKAREAPLLGANTAEVQRAEAASAPASQGGATRPESELGAKLHPTLLEGVQATVMQHPDMTVSQGTLIPCVLNTAMDSSAPGMVTCTTMQDVLGATGSVVLMEKGTKIVGEYQSTMRYGQSRLFVLWDRAETPKHVVISLTSPAADALGRGGFGGQVDTHFWQRMGSALLITAVDGLFSAGTAALSHSGSTFLNIGAGQGAATQALQGDANIQPTLTKAQGETVGVMVARDLDFSEVYGLRMVRQ